MKETDLYAPVKAFFEQQGYEVKAEVTDCDLVAIRESDPPVIVELKLSLSLDLLMQGIERQRITDAVYVAVPAGKGKAWTMSHLIPDTLPVEPEEEETQGQDSPEGGMVLAKDPAWR